MAHEELTYVNPTPVGDHGFAHDPQVPEGCTVIDLTDDLPFAVEHRDFLYATREVNGEPLDLHLYALVPRPNDPIAAQDASPRPCVVFCQGSAWHKQWLYGHYAHHVRLAEQGYVVVCAEYRPSDVAPFPAQAIDLKTAVRWVRAHTDELQVDPERMAVWGDSSGAHTAMMVGFTGDGWPSAANDPGQTAAVSAIVDWYGPTSLKHMNTVPSSQDHTGPSSPEGMVIGRLNVLEHQDEADQASPVTYVRPGLPPILMMHGGRDQLVAFDQACKLYKRLREVDAQVEFYKLDNACHGRDGFNSQAAVDLVLDFLRRTIGE